MGLVIRFAALGALLGLLVGGSSTAASADATDAVRLPPVAGIFDYQLGGSYRPAAGVQIVDRDRSSHPAPGHYNICYINAFQTQAEEKQFWLHHHPGLLLHSHGHLVQDPGWPGEYVLDTATASKRHQLRAIVGRWIDGCAKKGFDAIEPDNLDSWTRHGVNGALTQADNLALARLLATRAHADGLAIAQKNTVQVSSRHASVGFDFAIAEECQVYSECRGYTKAYGRHVVEIEYTDNPIKYYRQACAARAGRISIILRDRDVVPRGSKAYRYAHC